jgi:hypothetical protein
MEFSYKKNDNKDLFKQFSQPTLLNLENPQNYIPLYNTFFNLNDTNFNNINLLNESYLSNVNTKRSDNIFRCSIIDKKNVIKEKLVFFKYSPLLDPTKYIIGKYELKDTLLNLPNYNQYNSHPKTRDPNNSSYVDSFFTYLTSRLLHSFNFIHGVDFYGSYLSYKKQFNFNIADEIDYLNDSEFFHKNRGILFNVDNTYACNIFDFNTRTNKQRLTFDNDESNPLDVEISNLEELNILDNIFKEDVDSSLLTQIEEEKKTEEPDLVFNYNISKNSKSSSSECSSRTSMTEENNRRSNNTKSTRSTSTKSTSTNSTSSSESRTTKSSTSSSQNSQKSHNSYTTASEDVIYATIPKFPVQVIAMENCDDTLDSLIVNDNLTHKAWESIIIQILISLVTYQKVFSLTHNDLHTNNIMYNLTDKQFLYYKLNDKYYKVPTYGKIFKIIDFGRAIYKFKGNLVCSDSFHSKGDAATQYNFEPYFNKNKPRLTPNYSFDLCRLGCSIYDFISDDLNKRTPNNGILHMIAEWCNDDKGRNVLYKTNGEERYPDFKLYKMIARTVHKHIPITVLQDKLFDKYVINKKKIPRNVKIINIDNIPILTD